MNFSELVSANCLFKPLYERKIHKNPLPLPSTDFLRQFMNLSFCLDQKFV